MKKILIVFSLISMCLWSCKKEDNSENKILTPVSLLSATHYGANPNYTFEYDDQNQMIKSIVNNGVEVRDFYYDSNGNLAGFKEVVTFNATYPIRRFDIDVYSSTEISGKFTLYSPSDVLDPSQTVDYNYQLDGGLLKSFTYTYQDGSIYTKSFEHNTDGDLTSYIFRADAEPAHLKRFDVSDWDNKENTNIYTNLFNSFMSFDIFPGLKISKHNMLNKTLVYAPNDTGFNAGSYLIEYNSYDQITRMYSISPPVEDEDGNIIDPGGEEIDHATFDYILQ